MGGHIPILPLKGDESPKAAPGPLGLWPGSHSAVSPQVSALPNGGGGQTLTILEIGGPAWGHTPAQSGLDRFLLTISLLSLLHATLLAKVSTGESCWVALEVYAMLPHSRGTVHKLI